DLYRHVRVPRPAAPLGAGGTELAHQHAQGAALAAALAGRAVDEVAQAAVVEVEEGVVEAGSEGRGPHQDLSGLTAGEVGAGERQVRLEVVPREEAAQRVRPPGVQGRVFHAALTPAQEEGGEEDRGQ